MLGQSFFFYEIQRSGRLPPDTRVPWRGDSLKNASGGSLDGIYEGRLLCARNCVLIPLLEVL